MDADHLYDLAVRFYNSGNFANAKALARHLIYIAPLDARSFKIMGAVNQALEQHSFAIGAYQRAFLFDCHDSEIAFCLGQCYCFLGDYAKAHEWVEIARQLGCERADELASLLRQKMT